LFLFFLFRLRLSGLLFSLSFRGFTFSGFRFLLFFIFLLSLLALKEVLDSLFVVRDKVHTSHVRLEAFRNLNSSLSLVVLKDAAHSTFSGTHGSVKHVNVELLIRGL